MCQSRASPTLVRAVPTWARSWWARFALPTLRLQREQVHVVDQFADRKNNAAADHEQDRPHRIVDLLLEIRYRLRPPLRAHEHGAEEENDRHRSHDDPDQFEHGATLLLDVPLQHLTPLHRAVNVALRVHPEALGAGMIGRGGLQVLDEGGHLAVAGAADANAFADAHQLVGAGIGTGFGIRQVDGVVARNVDAARAAELAPFVEHLAVLVENLDAVVLAVTDEQAALAVDCDSVWLREFARAGTLVAPFLGELAGLVELD